MNETLKRSISGLIYVLILVSAVMYSNLSNMILFGIFLTITVFEFCTINKIKPIIPALGSVSIYFLFCVNLFKINENILLFLSIISVLTNFYLLFWLFTKKEIYFTKTILKIILKLYIVLSFLLMHALCFQDNGMELEYTFYFLLSIFILIWINDSFAYLVGKSLGKTKLFERISPKKTIEGFIGGLVFAILGSLILAKYWSNENYLFLIGLAIIVSVFGTIGDLVQSKFKRNANVKDSGNIMPGHGGIFDRLDSVIFATPFVFLYLKILYYVS